MSGLFEKISEAEALLDEVRSWSDEEVESLPRFYRQKAEELRRLSNPGDE